jgi:hypothetical protein
MTDFLTCQLCNGSKILLNDPCPCDSVAYSNFITQKTKPYIKMTTNLDIKNNLLIKSSLEQVLESWVGFPIVLTFELRGSAKAPYFTSQDIAPLTTPRMVKELVVSARMACHKDGIYHVDVSYNYTHFCGGSNGTKLGTIAISEAGVVGDAETQEARELRFANLEAADRQSQDAYTS